MFSSRTTDHLTFVSRQLAGLMEGRDIETALAELTRACPPAYADDVAYLRSLLTAESAATPGPGPGPFAVLQRLLPKTGRSVGVFFSGFVDYLNQSRVVFSTYWVGIVGLVWYFVAIAALAAVLSVVFSVSIAPAFAELYEGHRQPLPTLTADLLQPAIAGLPIATLLFTALVTLLVWFVARFHRRVQQCAPMPARWQSVPLIGRLVEAYNLGLYLNLFRLLRLSGLAPEQAMAEAAGAVEQPGLAAATGGSGDHSEFPALAELSIAAGLGNLDAELKHQCEQHIDTLALLLVSVRDRIALVLKLIVYAFVATLVVAMYLPIFKLGEFI
ncbi:MAG: hypothetical protein AAFX58_08145 [Pseudomonadota bacterium]